MNNRTFDPLAFGKKVLQDEARAISEISISQDFVDAATCFANTVKHTGHIVVSGMGKSGLVGTKLSATLSSIGLPSHFLHPSEAFHGDLGKIRSNDCVLLLSFGGGTEEVVSLAEILRQDNVNTVAITRSADSPLGKLVSHCLALGAIDEACPLDLAPTSSTTATLALGDALALTASRLLNFRAEDFHKRHPSGNLGKLMMPICDAMRFQVGKNLLLIHEDTPIKQAYSDVSTHAESNNIRRAGALLVVDATGKLTGIMTDGDFRRLVIHGAASDIAAPIKFHMVKMPKTLPHTARIRDAVHLVRQCRIDEIPVLDDNNKPIGLLDIQDLMALKVISN